MASSTNQLVDVVTHIQDEQHSLKQQLSELAIALNMEAQKRRHLEMENQQRQTQTNLQQLQVRAYRWCTVNIQPHHCHCITHRILGHEQACCTVRIGVVSMWGTGMKTHSDNWTMICTPSKTRH